MQQQSRSTPSSVRTPAVFNMKAYSIRPVHLFRWCLIFFAFCAFIFWYVHRWNLAKQLSPLQTKLATTASMETKGTDFYLDGKKLRILSGSMHYFRVVPEYWEDRLLKMKAGGLNTVTTYVPWNAHEPSRGTYHFKANLDIVEFLNVAKRVGLHVILRPGPYICAEWEFGGLPSWLLAEDEMEVRTMYPTFIDAMGKYFDELIPKVVPLQYGNGGPIIAVQVENEYGSFGKDKNYMKQVKEALTSRGIVEMLVSSENGRIPMENAYLKDVLMTANFQENADRHFDDLIRMQGADKPVMVMEFWTGWFDHWGEKHHIYSAEDFSRLVEAVLKRQASINFYMFHGGTNFGFMNGGNFQNGPKGKHQYLPTVTSYDYDAPIAEDGDITDKFLKIKELLKEYVPEETKNIPDLPADIPKRAYADVEITHYMPLDTLLEVNGKPIINDEILPMEKLPINGNSGQGYGYLLYRTYTQKKPTQLKFEHPPHDRAQIFLNGQPEGIVQRRHDTSETVLELKGGKEGENSIEILVENQGRVNYGHDIKIERKGIIGDVFVNGIMQEKWEMFPLEFKKSLLEAASNSIKWYETPAHEKRPALYKGHLEITDGTPADTFLDMSEWTKGVIFVNGFNLGRYWNVGPQWTYYLPGPLLHAGKNEIIIFEQDQSAAALKFSDKPDLGTVVRVRNDEDIAPAL
ncbi:beta-galactosidase-1-like protein 2 isoform X1 [Apostichopus japonicus]|uniref:beta-galactosidase-1-like protein 2 isoform X1 n=1 Tax=Stichopus japonicus TaxID=307972 RepID=UPI003AB11B8F